jgi:hypothetical protein
LTCPSPLVEEKFDILNNEENDFNITLTLGLSFLNKVLVGMSGMESSIDRDAALPTSG